MLQKIYHESTEQQNTKMEYHFVLSWLFPNPVRSTPDILGILDTLDHFRHFYQSLFPHRSNSRLGQGPTGHRLRPLP